jgi:hypothetical protein
MDTEKNQTLNKYMGEIFMFSPHIWQIWGNTGLQKGVIKCASENSTVNVKLMETYMDLSLCLYHDKL